MQLITRYLSQWLTIVFCLGYLALSQVALAVPDETLGAGDSIRITVFDNPDLSTEARISSAGLIRFPLIGTVKLGGLSPGAAVDRIASMLREGNFIRDPQVNLSITQLRSRQISILGQVARPGRYLLDETTTTITDLLAQAGGIAPGGDDVVTLIRMQHGQTEKRDIDIQRMFSGGDLSANLELLNGDTLYVRRAPVFYIHGEVQHAGAYRLERNTSVMQALAQGGGLSLRGTERGSRIYRRAADGVLTRLDVLMSDTVRPDDIIHIQESLF